MNKKISNLFLFKHAIHSWSAGNAASNGLMISRKK